MYMRSAILAALFLAVITFPVVAQEEVGRTTEGEGSWVYRGFTDNGDGTCAREWLCTAPAEGVGLRDEESLVFTDSVLTPGTCGDAGNGDGICRTCSNSEPATTCSWEIVPITQ